jgi:LL-diaminopimelate aminotransferase
MKLAERMDLFQSYFGTEMNIILTRMIEEGKDVINLGLGDPDVTPPQRLRETLAETCLKEENHHYPSYYSQVPLKKAISEWYMRRFDVELDPETEVLPLLGSAEGLFHIHTCLINTGDVALVPDPCYPAYIAGVKIAGGVVEPIPLRREKCFVLDLKDIDPEIARKAKMIWVNYPNNPTSSVVDEKFYEDLIIWAKEYDVVVVSDNPYSEIYFDGYRPPSFLQFEGAKEVGVEFNSLSKAFNCCGWRVGMMLGNREIVSAMRKLKSHTDRGIFYPLQVAAVAALKGSTDFMDERNKMFKERRDIVVDELISIGLDVERPKATFYVWCSLPNGENNSKEWCLRVLEQIGIWMIPGSMYGRHGEGFFRIALTQPAERLAEAMERLRGFMS